MKDLVPGRVAGGRRRLSPLWFELMPYMSAYSRLHMGEIFVLDVERLGSNDETRSISVAWRIIETGGQAFCVPAEGRNRRLTVAGDAEVYGTLGAYGDDAKMLTMAREATRRQ